jgi:hypothetical protein
MTSKKTTTGGIGAALARGTSGAKPGATSRRSKPMRVTLDLMPEIWADAQAWTGRAQMETHARVQLAPVLRALLAELTATDETGAPTQAARDLGARVLDRVKGGVTVAAD